MNAGDWEAARTILAGTPDRDRWPEALYERWFHDGGVATCEYPRAGGYRAAHGLARRYETGWQVTALAGGGVIEAARAATRARVEPLDWLPAAARRLAAGIGDAVLVRSRIDTVTGGFWHLWSRPWSLRPPERLVRVYAPVAPAAAEAFVRVFAGAAPEATRWYMKILTGTHQDGRRDGAVIYLDRRQGLGQRWLMTLLDAAAPLVAGPAPRCTAPLGDGFGWANDPGGGRSFGQWVCQRLAAVDAAVVDSPATFQAAVAASFAAHGADAAAPHLGPG